MKTYSKLILAVGLCLSCFGAMGQQLKVGQIWKFKNGGGSIIINQVDNDFFGGAYAYYPSNDFDINIMWCPYFLTNNAILIFEPPQQTDKPWMLYTNWVETNVLGGICSVSSNLLSPAQIEPRNGSGTVTNILIDLDFKGTIQVGTNFYSVKDLQQPHDDSWTNIEVSYGDRFWRPLPTDGIVTLELDDWKYMSTIKLRLRGNITTYQKWEKDFNDK